MKKSRFTEEQIVTILAEANRGEHTIGEVCRVHGVSEATFYSWRSSLGFRTPVQFRDGVRVALSERGSPSTHHRRREIEKERQAKKTADLYLQVVQS
jgi:transposase-like protein